jgi:hypothetical protein
MGFPSDYWNATQLRFFRRFGSFSAGLFTILQKVSPGTGIFNFAPRKILSGDA